MRVLLTSTSFQDTPGKHHDLLHAQSWEIVTRRGPLTEEDLLPIIGEFDAVICGDDDYTRLVLETGLKGRFRFLSKYGVGLDRIDLVAAKDLGIPVRNCPGVNQISVAEHVFALILSFSRNIHLEYAITKAGGWKRMTGTEIFGKTLGIAGLGAIGKEVAKRAPAFGMKVIALDPNWDSELAQKYGIERVHDFETLLSKSNILTLHVPHLQSTDRIINSTRLNQHAKRGLIIVNTSRGKLVETEAVGDALKSGLLGGYLADVLEDEPMPDGYPMKDWPNVIITPHIGSRTNESVERQGSMAVKNLIELVG
jgi:D-3-phosphoglycerate dehydrogenase / 2-oxoglutarate reductase